VNRLVRLTLSSLKGRRFDRFVHFGEAVEYLNQDRSLSRRETQVSKILNYRDNRPTSGFDEGLLRFFGLFNPTFKILKSTKIDAAGRNLSSRQRPSVWLLTLMLEAVILSLGDNSQIVGRSGEPVQCDGDITNELPLNVGISKVGLNLLVPPAHDSRISRA
jgi:hypothetical protein